MTDRHVRTLRRVRTTAAVVAVVIWAARAAESFTRPGSRGGPRAGRAQ